MEHIWGEKADNLSTASYRGLVQFIVGLVSDWGM